MDMREKTVKALEKAIQCFERYSGDEYGREYNYTHVEVEVLEDAVALLKAQEPVEPIPGLWDRDIQLYKCGACGGEIGAGGIAKYCFHCGQAVKWE